MKQKVGLDFLLIATTIAIYTEVSHFFIKFGGIRLNMIYFELPITLLISAIFYFPLIHNRFFRLVVALIPVTILYSIFDMFYHLLDRSVLMSDASELPLLFDFYPVVSWSVVIILPLFLQDVFILFLKRIKY